MEYIGERKNKENRRFNEKVGKQRKEECRNKKRKKETK